MNQTILTSDKIIRVKTTVTEEDRIVDFNDIETSVEYDEYWHDAPWDHCDGWEHEFIASRRFDHDGYQDSVGAVRKTYHNDDSGFIGITDDTVVNGWGCIGYSGCSKQVRAESIARAKRQAVIQLVKWYEYGWEYYTAFARYGDFMDNCGGIDCVDYGQEVADECAHNVADEMEKDDYIIVNRPEIKPYCRVSALRDKIRRQLDCS